jgi:hypothetical protein
VYSSSIILLYLTCLFIVTRKMCIDFAETFRVSEFVRLEKWGEGTADLDVIPTLLNLLAVTICHDLTGL